MLFKIAQGGKPWYRRRDAYVSGPFLALLCVSLPREQLCRFQVFCRQVSKSSCRQASGSMQGCGSSRVVVQQRLRLWLQWRAGDWTIDRSVCWVGRQAGSSSS